MLMTTLISCSMRRTEIPRSSLSLPMSCVRRPVSCGFIPAVGSSKSKSFGSEARARAISNRRWSPYGRFLANVSRLLRPTNLSRLTALSRASSSSRRTLGVLRMEPTMPPLRRVCMPVSTLSRALIVPKSRMFWNVRPIPIRARLCAPSRVMSCPKKTKLPAVGLSKPLTMLKNVVFSVPFGPMRLTMDLSGMTKLTVLTATRPPNTLVILRASSICETASCLSSGTGELRNTLALLALAQLLWTLTVGNYTCGSQEHHRLQQNAEEEVIVFGNVRAGEQGAAQDVAKSMHPHVELRQEIEVDPL